LAKKKSYRGRRVEESGQCVGGGGGRGRGRGGTRQTNHQFSEEAKHMKDKE